MKTVRKVLSYPFFLMAVVLGLFAGLCMGIEVWIERGEWTL